MRLAAMLEDGLRDFLEATGSVAPEQASAKLQGWSVLECIEHVVALETRYLGWIETGAAIAPEPNPDRELRLFTTVRNRLTKVDTPTVLRPRGRFRTLSAAVAEFKRVRDSSIRLARERGDDLYSIGARHPYFGALNAAELMRLMDAHARRHADQIRDICEALLKPAERNVQAPRKKKTAGFKRDAPDLPADPDTNVDRERLFADPDLVTIEDSHIQGFERANAKADTFRVEGSLLERVHLAGGEFGSAVWKDVRLVGCDLANVRAHRMDLVRVEFIDCRLTGLSGATVHWRDVLIQNSDVRFAQLQGGSFTNCEFDRCEWQDADIQNADLAGSVFRSCQLARADLHGAKLQDADLRGSELEGMLVGVTDLRGAIVDAGQAIVLARVVGLQIQ